MSELPKPPSQVGYKGKIYPLSPKGGEVMGLPVYPSVTDVPDAADEKRKPIYKGR